MLDDQQQHRLSLEAALQSVHVHFLLPNVNRCIHTEKAIHKCYNIRFDTAYIV